MKFQTFVAAGAAVVVALVMSAGSLEAASKAAPTEKLDLNAASVEQLATLPGIGPKLAARIVAYREKAGSFSSTEELMNVRGIGEKNFQKLEKHITVGAAAPRKGAGG